MKQKLILMAIILSLVLSPVTTKAASYEELRDKKVQYDEEKQELLQRQKEIRIELEEKKRSTKELMSEIERLEKERKALEQELEEAEHLYITVLDDIEQLTESINKENESIDARDEVIRDRMLALQARPLQTSWFYQLLTSESLADAWNRYQKAQQLIKADLDLIEVQEQGVLELKEERQQVRQKEKEAKWTRDYLKSQRDLLQEQTSYQNELLEELQLRESELSNEESKVMSRYEENMERRAVIEEEMQQLLKRQVEEQHTATTDVSTEVEATPSTISPLPTENIRCIEGLNEEQFRKRMSQAGVLSNSADAILKIATEHQIDPVLFAAITLHETGNGTSNAVRSYNNPGGMMNPKTNWSTLIRYPSLEAGLRATAKTLDRLVNKGGLKTVESLGRVYAPIGAANDPTGLNRHWPSRVTQYINELGGMACR